MFKCLDRTSSGAYRFRPVCLGWEKQPFRSEFSALEPKSGHLGKSIHDMTYSNWVCAFEREAQCGRLTQDAKEAWQAV